MEGKELEKTKSKYKNHLNAEVKNVLANKKTYENLFKAHKHIQAAKNTLVDTLSKSATYKHSILGNESKPEGFVVSVNGRPIKFVDRQHFSAANFEWNSKANPEDNPTVLSWGRFNPPTTGHEKIVKTGAELAKRSGAKHSVVASRTTDKNNPLTPSQKLQWLKTMFPGQNTTIAGKDKPTLIAQLQHLANSGVRDLTMVVGQDRVKDFQHILAHYNGEGAGKLFNFNKVRVISAGDRDADSDGTKGMSGSKMRQAAKDHDFKTFRTGVPKHINDKQAKELFHSLRQSMTKVGSMTSADALTVYSKKVGKLGKQAQKEIERRRRSGLWKDDS